MRSNRVMSVTHAAALYLRNYCAEAVIFTLLSKGKRISTADNAAAVILESRRSVVARSLIPLPYPPYLVEDSLLGG